jgi:hypothetical protein
MAGKRIVVWLASLIGAIIITYILFEYTPVAIPFFEGGFFTVISVLLMTFALSVPIDTLMKGRVYDERGVHLGIRDVLGGSGASAPPPAADKDYRPIVSREERAKRAQQLAKGK